MQCYEDCDDEFLQFKDSERESVISFFDQNDSIKGMYALDTPTRLVNHSNEFLPSKKQISPS